MFTTAIWGQKIWHISIYDLSLPWIKPYIPLQYQNYNMVNVLVAFFVITIMMASVFMFLSTLRKVNDKKQAVKDMLPVVCLVLVEAMWTHHSYFDAQLSLLMINFGCEFSLLCIKLILSTTVKID